MSVRSIAIGSLVVALGLPVSAAAQGKLLHHAIDRRTGSIVRVFKVGEGTRVELESPSLFVAREMVGARVTTTLKDRHGVVSATFDRKTVTVRTPDGRVSAKPGQTDKLAEARRLLAEAPATRNAVVLIERLGFGPDTPVLPLLLTTRTFLAAVTGRTAAFEPRFAPPPAPAPARLIRVSLVQQQSGSMTPTECWNTYAKEAIAAYMDYEECIKDKAWWEILDNLGCGLVYDMRAIGAFAWWTKCVSLN